MGAVSVQQPTMVRDPASMGSDPRRVATLLHVDKIEAELLRCGIREQWTHVLDGIRYGFNMGACAPLERTLLFRNHSSINQNPEFINQYIADEQAAGRYSRAFDTDELETLIGPFRTSPLGLVPKPHSDKFRMIQDLSYPRNDPHIASVNAGIDSDDFPTEWGTFQDVSELILALPAGCVAATFDISAAYRITPVHPSQQHMFCVSWQGKVYIDFAVAFGCASSAGVFGSVANMLVAIYNAHGVGPIKKWVDDFFAIRMPGHSWTEEDFIELTGR